MTPRKISALHKGKALPLWQHPILAPASQLSRRNRHEKTFCGQKVQRQI
jgi:Tfp pilus assembly major pilin PilA